MKFWEDMLAMRQASREAAAGEDPKILPFTKGLVGPDQFRSLIAAMQKRGYSAARIDKLMGQNFLRFARDVWES